MAKADRQRKRGSFDSNEEGHAHFTRRVYENAKVTIPKEIREVHDIKEGDFVVLKVVKVLRNGRTGTSTDARSAPAESGAEFLADTKNVIPTGPDPVVPAASPGEDGSPVAEPAATQAGELAGSSLEVPGAGRKRTVEHR